MGLAFTPFRQGQQPPVTLAAVRLIGGRFEHSNTLAKRQFGYAPGVARIRATGPQDAEISSVWQTKETSSIW